MAWVQSHQEIRDHPKTRKLARKLGVGLPAVVGHLHLLWHWALDHATDGDLSKFDDDDIADAAMWEGDSALFVSALRSCGPAGESGFVDADGRLHDWEQYGGKYGKRVEAAKKAAATRWRTPEPACDPDAPQVPTQCESNANAMRTHADRTATAMQIEKESKIENREQLQPEPAALVPTVVAPKPAPPARRTDPLFDAVIAACGMNYAEMTSRQRTSTGVAVAQLRGVKADPDEVAPRAVVYRRKFPQAACTPNALASNWAALNPASQPAAPLRLSKSMQAFENVARRIGAIDDGGAA